MTSIKTITEKLNAWRRYRDAVQGAVAPERSRAQPISASAAAISSLSFVSRSSPDLNGTARGSRRPISSQSPFAPAS